MTKDKAQAPSDAFANQEFPERKRRRPSQTLERVSAIIVRTLAVESLGADSAMLPVVMRLSLEGGEAVNCLAMSVSGRRVHVAMMKWAADQLIESGSLGPNAEAAIVFQSQALGNSPEIRGIVRQVKLSETGASLSIAIEDWDRLAQYWSDIKLKRAPSPAA